MNPRNTQFLSIYTQCDNKRISEKTQNKYKQGRQNISEMASTGFVSLDID